MESPRIVGISRVCLQRRSNPRNLLGRIIIADEAKKMGKRRLSLIYGKIAKLSKEVGSVEILDFYDFLPRFSEP